ncbi:MAG: HAD hydrolase family protein [Succinivibrionaceae bacterium]|nr:HAD hydrolase family protein [Succinivibrionaceae bacterium]
MTGALLTCWGLVPPALLGRLAKVRLLCLDVDGTLTDGGILLDSAEGEQKRFYAQDGYGISALRRAGLEAAIITGRNSRLVARRAAELGIPYLFQGVADKARAVADLGERSGIDPALMAAVGDDLNDLPLFGSCGLTACPSDAHPYMQSIADLTLHRPGGHGAVREICDLILIAQGRLGPHGGPVDPALSLGGPQ